MTFRSLTGALLAATLTAGPALAGSWDAEKALCADAVAAEAGVDSANYDVKLAKARDGATKRLTVELRAADGGATLVGECKIRRDAVVEAKLKA
ncbi:hypothetical protein [Amphiplicatus metriothermophilus]|uniref:HdeA/HdeB family protein n=1 Tax=Amphiplicatus metriothermophilus TaxID=1519374 RepID=A0A239Q057_9PROT|nr:hypothetical protein [Amphiplicatus metriothermophilus]MBB5520043.1 hypothetical protein [Amphiplicatus metriothermophilus]SNT75810.1 hypothetical protein SAMN06297382_2914 [Amphiplicatus metriothermophilus]